VTVAVCEEHEILRAGLVALLAREPLLVVSAASPDRVNGRGVDLAIVSNRAACSARFDCPIVVVSEQPLRHPGEVFHNQVLAVLHRGTLTVSQLLATVRAAARLRPHADPAGGEPAPLAGARLSGPSIPQLSAREHQVLRLLADGESTRGIAERLNYSERTVKNIVHDLLVKLDCRTRAHAVALAARRGVI
jgi:DNA-binding NarL/FixJ family response regulator